jgi:hydrogenase maturation protease
MSEETVEQIARAVLYEGYLLYPYRASALKNRQRWNFGVIYPKVHSEAQEGTDPWLMQTQCLALGDPLATIRIKVRFLRLVERIAAEASAQPWQEAAECEIAIADCSIRDLLANPFQRPFSFPQGRVATDDATRHQRHIEGVIETQAERTVEGAWRIAIRIKNLTPFAADPHNRQAVLLQSLVSTHTILHSSGGTFLSLLDPPEPFREATAQCENIGTWPVLAGDVGQPDTMLSSPIILYDYPQVAPESPGELFDGTEIDEILSLRILTMTDEEKSQARRTDERARNLLARTEALAPEDFMRLHGVLRPAVRSGADR